MLFQFQVRVSKQDYIDYNIFWMTRSVYGKKPMLTLRILLALLSVATVFFGLYNGGFAIDSFVGYIPLLLVMLLVQILLPRLFAWLLKGQIKLLRKSGKMGYSPESVLEFYEDRMVETTSTDKTERLYAAVERVSVVDNRMVYIHVNNVMAYMVPFGCFASQEECNRFFGFLHAKCVPVDVY